MDIPEGAATPHEGRATGILDWLKDDLVQEKGKGVDTEMEQGTTNPSDLTYTDSSPQSEQPTFRKKVLRAFHYQPPALCFYPSEEIPIAVTLGNAIIRRGQWPFVTSIEDENKVPRERSPFTQVMALDSIPAPGKMFPVKFVQPWLRRIYTPPTGPQPYNPQISYTAIDNLLHPRPEGTFPTTSFDVFAQGSKKKVVCAVSWDMVASPNGQLNYPKSDEHTNEISWNIGDILSRGASELARKIYWVNFAPSAKAFEPDNEEAEEEDNLSNYYTNFHSISAVTRKACGKFWMLHPPRTLPNNFYPPQLYADPNDIFFYFSSAQIQLPGFITRVYTEMGFPAEKVKEIRNYWEETARQFEGRAEGGILVKFLVPKEFAKIYPLEIQPMPVEFIRGFLIAWALGPDAMPGSWASRDEDEDSKIKKVVEAMMS